MDAFLSNKLRANYDDYYEGKGILEWRRLGAIGKANNIMNLCNEYLHESILEIGSGDGSILKRLSDAHFGNELYSLEISKTAVQTISEKKIKGLVEVKLFDGYNIPYENNRFDLVILSHVIEHLEYPRKMLYEASRVGKYIFVEVPLEDNLRLEKDYKFNKVGHINFFSPKTIRRLIQTCDIEVLFQIVTNQLYHVYKYQYGNKAFLRYLPKEFLLRLMPAVAPIFLPIIVR